MSWSGQWDGAWDGAWDGQVGDAVPPTTVRPARGEIARVRSLYSALQRWPELEGWLARTSTYGTLQQIGPIVIDLIGPVRVYRGDSFTFRLTVTDDKDPPEPVDLTGIAIEFEVKPVLDGPDPALIRKTIGAGIALLTQSGDTLGMADVTGSSADTDIAAKIYWLDVVTIAGGIRTHVIGPRMFIVDPVVNAP